jgi:transposase
MDYWAKAPLAREQTLLFYPTLDEAIGQEHPVRCLDEILRAQDWTSWEAQYNGRHGQPPIPPWILAGVILYGMIRGIRSSRVLEYLCGHNIDYIWLTERRTIDYSTICKFRTRFHQPLKDLFRQLGKLAVKMDLVRLVEVMFDGTRVKANASRAHTWTAERLAAALKELEALFEKAMAETAHTDATQQSLVAEEPGQTTLPPELATVQARQEKLQALLAEARAADEARRKEGINPQKNPAQIPKADTDSTVMPNKEGGNAPNYTPLAASDAHADWIVDCDVVAEPVEHAQTLPTVDRIAETFGQKPGAMAADKAHGTGQILAGMEQRGVDFYTPVESPVPEDGNPAKRDDPQQPVAEADWGKLPRNDKKKLAKSCFVYDAQKDCYYCPLGRVLNYEETKKEQRSGVNVDMRVYRCKHCDGCPLAEACREAKAKRGRSIRRDQFEPLRERMARKMKSPAGKAIYGRRMHAAETPFAYIKGVMGVRQFLLRGLEKVKTEWTWVCTAYNITKLLANMGRLRAELANMANERAS